MAMTQNDLSSSMGRVARHITGLINSYTLGVLASFSARVFGTGLSFFFNILLARILGPAETGIYFLALTIITIGATLARLGLDNAVLKFGSVAHDQGDTHTLAELYRQSFWLVAITGVGISLLIGVASPYLPLGGENSGTLQTILPVMLLVLTPAGLLLLQGEFFTAIRAPGLATISQGVLVPMVLVLGASALLWRGEASVFDIALLYAVSITMALIVATGMWMRRQGWPVRGSFDTRLLVHTSLPLLLVACLHLVMSWTDILVLGAVSDSATVGVYGIATRIAGLGGFVLIAVNSVTAPRFAALYARGDHKGLERLAQQSAAWMFMAVLPIVLLLLVFPERILQLFGDGFIAGETPLRILAIGQLVSVTIGSVGYLLMMTGHQRALRNAVLQSAALNIILNLILVPMWGSVGAAISTVTSLIFLNLVAYQLVRKLLGINTLMHFRPKPAED
jgi:O-antigen/teichoic acid export membrane protein